MRKPNRNLDPATVLQLALVLSLALGASGTAQAAVPAFPGAEGWGAETPGGRGGRTLVVDTLEDVVADDGTTSLREALLETGPRTIVFAVSGVSHLRSPLVLGETPSGQMFKAFGQNPHGFVTIAGQTAPGGGIALSGYPFIIGNYVSDVVVRFLRFRNSIRDAEGLHGPVSLGDGIDFQHTRRVVIDHCSVAWATDEGISLERIDNHDITVQYSLVAETLLHGGHESGDHSRAMNVAYGADRISIHHNLFLSNNRRSPHLVGDRFSEITLHPVFDVRNNLIYNYGERGLHFGIGAQANVVKNLLLAGPETPTSLPLRMEDDDLGTLVYLEGNQAYWPDGDPIGDGTQIGLVRFPDWQAVGITQTPFDAPPVTTHPVAILPTLVGTIGALPHDTLDLRVLETLADGTGSVGGPAECQLHACATPAPVTGSPAVDSDRDGLPDAWETSHGLNPWDETDANADDDGNGYTELEEYLEALAVAPVVPYDDIQVGGTGDDGDILATTPPCATCRIEARVALGAGRGPLPTRSVELAGWLRGTGTRVSLVFYPALDRVVLRWLEGGTVRLRRSARASVPDGGTVTLSLALDGDELQARFQGRRLFASRMADTNLQVDSLEGPARILAHALDARVLSLTTAS